ncbi:ABC transporter substrate-binding protein [Ruegeria sp. HKCCD8929]|uniref:ABC transporter substrate-binding protein n=1 Tax=Ruegeria sp. HKCCD8929 TaxID=2683006 RepID=UPI001489990B|nr:ABC transporter substrate-binding protein [Ruegeria sp. HKCCD8929]
MRIPSNSKGAYLREACATALVIGMSATFAAAAERGGTLTVAIPQMGASPDPVVTTFGTNWMTAAVACEGLFAIDESWSPQPMLAERFSYNDDGTRLTVTLRDGITFHSGAPLAASDVVASLERFKSSAGIGASFAGVVESISAPDDKTVVFDLAAASPIVPGILTVTPSVILSEASLNGANATTPVEALDCTGPYKVAEFSPDQGVTFERFDSYVSRSEPSSAEAGAKHAWADTIEFRLQPEASIRRDSLLTGEVDIAMELPTDFYDAVELSPETQPVVIANQQSLTVVFNTQKGPAADENLRRAIYYALDKDPIMLASVGNPEFYTLDPSWVPDPASIWHSTAGVPDNHQSPNLELAKEYLAKSNYNGEELRWLTATEQHQKHYLTAITAVQQLRDFGLNIQIQEMPIATYIQQRADVDAMDMFSSFLPTYVDPTSIAYLNASYPGFWTDQQKLDLMDELARTIDTDERVAIFNRLHELAYAQFPFIKYGTEAKLYAVRVGVEGASASPVSNIDFYNVVPPSK